MDKVKITIKGAYGTTNFGDDLLMCLFEKYFLKNFNTIDINIEGQYGVEYPRRLLEKSKYLEKYFNEDWLIYGGGTLFFSFQPANSFFLLIKKAINKPQMVVKKIKKIFSKKNDRSLKVAQNYAFLGFGLGPFYENIKIINSVKKILAGAKFIGLRDSVSLKYCKEWGIDANLGADIVFSSYFDYDVKKTKIENYNILNKRKKKIGIIVRDWDWENTGKKYYTPIQELYKTNTDYEFRFIIYAPDKDKFWMNFLNKDKDTLIWNPNIFSIQQFLDMLNEFDAFITTRYHGGIIGTLLGKPVICVEIEPKLRILTKDIPEMLLWEKPFDLNDLQNLVSKLDYDVDYKSSLCSLKLKSDNVLDKFKQVFKDL